MTDATRNGEASGVSHNPPMLPCPHCSQLVMFQPIPMSFFEGKFEPCSGCATPIDSYELILQTLLRGGFDFWVLAAVGAHVSIFSLTLQPQEVLLLRLRDYGIPADARIIGINYTPRGEQGFLFPIEVHGNRPIKYTEPMERHLYPMPMGEKGLAKATLVNTAVTWVPNPKVDVIWDLLVEAFHRFYVAQLEAAIIPAHTAVEVAIGRLLTERIESAVPGRAEDFLKKGATYGYQLNVLLPLLIRLKGMAQLPERIQQRLRQLNTFRNALAHSGEPKAPLVKGDVAECLTAALLAIHYVDVVRPKLLDG
jgi:hypothetical protein